MPAWDYTYVRATTTAAPKFTGPKSGGRERLLSVFMKNTNVASTESLACHQPRALGTDNIFDSRGVVLEIKRTKVGDLGGLF